MVKAEITTEAGVVARVGFAKRVGVGYRAGPEPGAHSSVGRAADS